MVIRRFPRRGRGFWFGLAIEVLAPLLAVTTRWRIEGGRHLPRRGGVLVASNHLSFADPLAVTLFTLAAGRVPRFFAKAELWDMPVVKWVMASGGHIPVQRGKASALDAYRDGVTSVRAGECVVVFPEGGFTERPDGWPSKGKTGLARMALTTGVPVVPLACWGTQELLPVGSWFPRAHRRPVLHLVAGPPVDLSDLVCERPSASQLREATDRIMDALTGLLSHIRGQDPPAETGKA
ncbi:lysophospholipid acyltransferase family protein [Saccharomonospora viridis]|uniref:1-acyl-sn-glycerol-3-phosphate acyltransferase n=2 Tax=Saccharomonospora viridis TaxID=1852 RepID=C7MZ36_SACVD|nr:lysophospholipid acyltransferase family protein [Saccharomonospora viridis]ACU96157.1 1-acyl-sn-glycerol-3-phosphate acyltransferase [Saccharomonospora viridis DSM 43017]KHF45338.1 glycerol acyltransferase [Saccharomonospora viridis]SFP78986.1 1-acyl-sn-glycerol-3-phosphate acyltransferases [Saccharomonospora viridis]